MNQVNKIPFVTYADVNHSIIYSLSINNLVMTKESKNSSVFMPYQTNMTFYNKMDFRT